MASWLRITFLTLALGIAGALHGQIILVNATTYTGQTLADSIQVNASTYAYFTGGTTFTGPNANFGSSAGLYWQQVGALTGKTFTMGNSAYVYVSGASNSLSLNSSTLTTGNGSYFYLSGANTNLSLDASTTMTGGISLYSDGNTGTAITNQGTLTHNLGSGSIYAANFTNSGAITANAGTYLYLGYPSAGYNATNTGSVTADGTGTYVYLRGNFDNNGTVTAQNNGNLLWDGNNTTANLGTVVVTGGGRALLNGTVDNTSTNFAAPTSGVFELYGGTIKNGTIASGALAFTSSGGYLDGAALTGDLTLGTSSYVRLTNGASFTGTNVNLGNSAGVYWQQTGTLTSHTLALGSNAYLYVSGVGNSLALNSSTLTMGNGAYVYLSGANTSLSLGAGTTVTGGVSLYSDGSAGTTIANQGTITHNVGSGSMYAANFTNSGSITATGGAYLYLGYPSAGYNTTNTGSVTADGTNTFVYLRGNFDNNGTVTAQNSGNLLWDGGNTTANLGTVVLTGGGRALLNGTIDNTSENLIAPTGGTFELYGGTIKNGTIASGALTFTSSGGYLDGATLTGDLAVGASSYVRLINGAGFTGTNVSLANSAGLYWQRTGTLAGHTISLGSNAYVYVSGVGNSLALTGSTLATGSGAYFYLSGANTSLSLDAGTTVTGGVSLYSDGNAGTTITNQGTLTHNVGSGSLYAASFTNSGSITANGGSYLYVGYPSAGYNTTNTGSVTADGTGTYVYLRGNLDNNGTVTAQNSGSLVWDGSTTTANLGAVVLTGGGRALLNGTIDNSSANFTAPTGGAFELYGGTITGGTIASGALSFTSSGGYLDGISLTGNLSLPASSYVRLVNGSSFTGTNLTLGSNAGIYWQQAGTLAGDTIAMGNGSYIYLSGVGRTLILDPTTTATGTVSIYSDGSAGTAITNQGTLTHNSGSGSIYAANFTNAGTITSTSGYLYLGYPSASYNTTNTGSVTADGAATYIYLRGNVDNNGTLSAQNSGNLLWDGSNTTANLGTVVLSGGGRALLNGTLSNLASTLTAPTGGAFELYGGTITGGSVASGALAFTSSGGYLDNVSVGGDLNLSASGSYVRLLNGSNFTGSAATLAANTGLYWQQVGTLTGKAITQGTGSYIYVTGAGNGITLDPTTTITGNVSVYTDTNIGTAITNQGVLTHNSGTGYLYANTLVNQGSVVVNGGSFYFGYYAGHSSTNASGASLTVAGTSNVYVNSPFTNVGQVLVQSGTLYTASNMFTNTAGGLLGGAGTINGDLTLAGGTLAPGNSIGTLTVASSDFMVTGASVFSVEMDGATSDRLTFQNPTSIVNLGAGLLQLSINLLAAPTEGTTYTIMNIASGGSGYSGYFAGLPNNGDALVANFGAQTYSLNVYYLANSIILQVPEPSTYALMGAGLVMFALRLRRRVFRR